MPSKHFTDQATSLSLQPRLFSSCDGSRVREQGRTSQQQKRKATVNRLLFCFETRSYPMAWADLDLDVWPMLTSAYLDLSNSRMQMGTMFPTKPHGPASSSLAVQDRSVPGVLPSLTLSSLHQGSLSHQEADASLETAAGQAQRPHWCSDSPLRDPLIQGDMALCRLVTLQPTKGGADLINTWIVGVFKTPR